MGKTEPAAIAYVGIDGPERYLAFDEDGDVVMNRAMLGGSILVSFTRPRVIEGLALPIGEQTQLLENWEREGHIALLRCDEISAYVAHGAAVRGLQNILAEDGENDPRIQHLEHVVGAAMARDAANPADTHRLFLRPDASQVVTLSYVNGAITAERGPGP